MLYASDGTGCVVLVLDALANDVFHAREVLPYCVTWGDARRELHIKYFGELVDYFIGPGEEAPPDDHPLDARELTEAENWPGLFYEEIAKWMPGQIIDPAGKSLSELLHAGGLLVAEHGDALIDELRELGVACTEDRAVWELFVD
jgi:hypothetical protein